MPRQKADERGLLLLLEALYAEVDSAHAGTTCPRSSECCRFGITGREPQVTSLELALVRRALGARGGLLKAGRRALPLHTDHAREGTCPMLDRSGGCAIYAARPLGCRTFFCQRADVLSTPTRATQRDWVRRLEELSSAHEVGGDKPRALRSGLGLLDRR
jgi:Fe-S-cluster containining protein